MSKDTIYRQDVMNVFDCSIGGVPAESVKYVSEYADKMMSRINALSSAKPERKTGKWIDDGDPLNWVCSECGYRVARYNNTPYCPYCGAKMKENEDEMTLTFNPPITEEQWDIIEDVDFDHTDSITFYTKHGKEVEFVKRKRGKWILIDNHDGWPDWKCSQCGGSGRGDYHYCPWCNADMREGQDGDD